LPNGSVEVFAQADGSTVAPRRIFLTQLIDASGNAVTLNYDSQLRLTTVTDASGRNTTFSYELSAQPLLVTKITDPFGRSALLGYDRNDRLSAITDVIGLTSSFHYNAASPNRRQTASWLAERTNHSFCFPHRFYSPYRYSFLHVGLCETGNAWAASQRGYKPNGRATVVNLCFAKRLWGIIPSINQSWVVRYSGATRLFC
jgi:YD repeat-containing protein